MGMKTNIIMEEGQTAVYIPRYRNYFGDKRDYIRGFGYQGGGSRQGWDREIAELQIGKEYKDALSEPGNWTMGMGGFGEMLPDHRYTRLHSIKLKKINGV